MIVRLKQESSKGLGYCHLILHVTHKYKPFPSPTPSCSNAGSSLGDGRAQMQKSLLVFVFFRCVLGRHDLYEFGHHPYIETVAEHTVALLGGDALWEGWGAGGETAKDQNKRTRGCCDVTFPLPDSPRLEGKPIRVAISLGVK